MRWFQLCASVGIGVADDLSAVGLWWADGCMRKLLVDDDDDDDDDDGDDGGDDGEDDVANLSERVYGLEESVSEIRDMIKKMMAISSKPTASKSLF